MNERVWEKLKFQLKRAGGAGFFGGVKIGLLGGSFDPVHNGHLALARAAIEAGGMDRVWMIPAAQAPLKPNTVQASAEDRLAMLRLAVQGLPGVDICEVEIRRGGVNYTIDTVRALRGERPDGDFFWIIGADQLARLSRWREIESLVREVVFLCAVRPGHDLCPPEDVAGLRWRKLDCAQWDVSSTEIRARAARGEPLDGLVPNNAIEYLLRNRLYRF